MQQRQLRLGDVLDDYCPRERRLTNHAVVAMIGLEVKQVRCTTCDAEHEYKHAKVPRQRRKGETTPALYSQVLSGAPKRVAHDAHPENGDATSTEAGSPPGDVEDVEDVEEVDEVEGTPGSHIEELFVQAANAQPAVEDDDPDVDSVALTDEEPDLDDEIEQGREEGPVHRPLIRASLPRHEGQPPASRPAPEFTIRQPAGRQNRFRPRQQRSAQPFQGSRSNGNGPGGGGPSRGMPRHGGRPPVSSRLAKGQGQGRKRSK